MHALLQLGLVLLLRSTHGHGHPRVGGALEDMVAVDGALAQRGPGLGVVVLDILGLGRGGGDVVLQSVEVGEQLGHSGGAAVVYYESKSFSA